MKQICSLLLLFVHEVILDLPKFQFSGGGGPGGGYSEVKYSKCQDLPKFPFSGGGGILYLISE